MKTERTCTICRTIKNREEFYARSSYCKPCARTRAQEYYRNSGREKYFSERESRNLKATKRSRVVKYGVTHEMFETMVEEVDAVCPGCSRNEIEFDKKWCVDHCHTSGKVRGVLCSRCNIALGHVQDDIKTLEGLISYLKFAL